MKNQDEQHSLLRKNRELICKLKSNVDELKESIKCISKPTGLKKCRNTSTPKNLKISSFQTHHSNTNYSKKLSQHHHSKENTYYKALHDQGNLRVRSPKPNLNVNSSNYKQKCHHHDGGKHKKKSILCTTPQIRSHIIKNQSLEYNFNGPNSFTINKTPKKRVCFSPSAQQNNEGTSNSENDMDVSMMGYDWIAHMVDNTSSINGQTDEFFKDIERFRQENLPECNSLSNKIVVKSPKKQGNIIVPGGGMRNELSEPESSVPLCCTGDGAYTLNRRCNLVPIHGPYSECPVCKSKPKISSSNTENVNRYIRVSIPRSTLQSPYRIKHHRRKSYDNSDSVALATHCLAGWQNSKPVYAPGPTNIDLASDSTKTKFTSLKALRSLPR